MDQDQVVRPDYRKTLATLRDEWCSCTKCELGQRREATGGKFVFGEGTPRGIMFIGEGPGKDEEVQGRPFIGRSGKFLRHIISKLQLNRCYLTNVVTCRSCGQAYDGEGNPRVWTDRRTGEQTPAIKDQAPLPGQMQACLPRLYEEIYMVDPVLIVALGGPSAEVLSGKPASVLAESGMTKEIRIPGAGYRPNLTAKRKVWVRKVRGEMIMPVDQNQVSYLMMTLVHPAYAIRKRKDERMGNPLEIFVGGMQKAVELYERYALEVYGDAAPQMRQLSEEEILEAIED